MQAGYEVIPAVVDDLRAMHEASVDAGAEIAVRWAYRSYAEQQGAFALLGPPIGQAGRVAEERPAGPLRASARYGDRLPQRRQPRGTRGITRTGRTPPAGDWMMDNAWNYGFVLSYPKGSQDLTCYAYEPWHYRYVGRDLASRSTTAAMTPREYLWELARPND